MVRKISTGFRKLTREEQKLWNFITRHDDVYPGRRGIDEDEAEEFVRHVPVDMPTAQRVAKKIQLSRDVSPSPGQDGKQVDKRTAQRLKRGKRGIDAVLDLHGMSKEAAHFRLMEFVERAYNDQKRTLLIITGKGQRTGGPGVLKEALPRWLNELPISQFVLIFEQAQPRDGGAGASYVLLRRKRAS